MNARTRSASVLNEASALSLATSSRLPVIPQRVSNQPFQSIPARFNSQPKTVAKKGWLVYHPDAKLFAVGKNLIGILVTGRDAKGPPMTVEKVEMHVNYRS